MIPQLIGRLLGMDMFKAGRNFQRCQDLKELREALKKIEKDLKRLDI